MSTWCSLHYHWICSTKHRLPLIRGGWRARFHEYIGGTVRGLGGIPVEVGGVEDHVHLLLALRTTHQIAEFSRELKKSTSLWASQNGDSDFQWQEGYAVFTVSASMVETVRRYIQGQEAHHRRASFQDEFRAMLARHGLESDSALLP